jgi:tetratricopeptide (TPR) repeat protein
MKLLQSIVIFTCLISFALILTVTAQDENRASKTWEVKKYDIVLNLPQSETDRNMAVKAVLSLKNTSGTPASTLTLRISQNADVSAVKVNDATADFSKREEKISNTSSLQRIIVRLSSFPENSIFSVSVEYKLNVKENSGLSALSPVGSQFLPLSFWYPTPNSWFFARGADYAPFNLTVVTGNSTNLDVVSSGDGGDPLSSGKTKRSFDQKLNGQPFFIAGSWDFLNSNGVAVYLPNGADAEQKKRGGEIAAFAAEAKAFVENLLGKAPDVPISIVGVNRGAGFSGGGTIFVDDSYFNRQKIDSQTAMNVAESVAKIWLGNQTLVDGDGYGVIREGLTRYIATQFLEKKYGKDVADIERLRQRVAYAAVSKRDSPLKIASPLDDYYYVSVSNKGAMLWRLLANKVGQDEFFKALRGQMNDKYTDLNEIRATFPSQKALLDYEIDEVLDMNLLVGLPRVEAGKTKSALRNTGAIDVTVDIVATTSTGEKIKLNQTIPAKGFGEVIFTTASKIIRTEIDAESLYPQTDYTDDVVPRDSDESDPIINIKRAFDKQDFTAAEKNSRAALQDSPNFDDARIWLARSLLAQNKITEAEREFRTVLDEKLPTARSLAWANVGLGETVLKSGQKSQAAKYFGDSIKADAEYGATLAARFGRAKSDAVSVIGEDVKAYFSQFDKAAVSGRKADLDALIVIGEVPRFSGGVAGAQIWQTKVMFVDKIDANNVIVEVSLNIRLLNRDVETGTAVFQISKIGNSWKLSNVEMFEVR